MIRGLRPKAGLPPVSGGIPRQQGVVNSFIGTTPERLSGNTAVDNKRANGLAIPLCPLIRRPIPADRVAFATQPPDLFPIAVQASPEKTKGPPWWGEPFKYPD